MPILLTKTPRSVRRALLGHLEAQAAERLPRHTVPLESGQGEVLSPALDVYGRPYEGTGIEADPRTPRAAGSAG